MFLKELVHKSRFDIDGYVLLDTTLSDNEAFDKLILKIENSLSDEIKNPDLKKLGGYIMGNFGINQGPFGAKLFFLFFSRN